MAVPDPAGVRFLEVKRIAVRRSFAFPPHRHATYELFLPEAGTYRCAINGQRFAAAPGDAILVQPGDIHADTYEPGAAFAIAVLEPVRQDAGGILRPDAPIGVRQVSLGADPVLAALARVLAAVPPRQGALAVLEPAVLACFRAVVAALPPSALDPEALAGRDGDAFRARASELLAALPAAGFDAAALAGRLGLSRRAMEMRFRRHLGRPPGQALLAQKIDEAERLLHDGLSVGAAAEALGFANQFHFSRVFKRFTGRSPADLR